MLFFVIIFRNFVKFFVLYVGSIMRSRKGIQKGGPVFVPTLRELANGKDISHIPAVKYGIDNESNAASIYADYMQP